MQVVGYFTFVSLFLHGIKMKKNRQIRFGISYFYSFRKRTVPITFAPLCLELPETP